MQYTKNGAGLLGVLVGAAVCAPAHADIPVLFEAGHTVGQAHGFLHGIHDQIHFAWRARSGQHLRVAIRGGGSTHGVVTFPSGRQDGGPGGVVLDDTVHETGRYRLRVSESTMGMAWHGRVSVTVTRR